MIVAFCGLGQMGRPMAANLVAAGHTVRAWNRTPGKAPPGAVECRTPREAASGAEVAITMVADDAAVEAVVFGPDGFAGTKALHCGMSTISMQLSQRLGEAQRYVAAPVFGRPDAAAARKLWICAGGAPQDIALCRPLFEAMGQGVFEIGTAAQASVAKLCGNFLLISLIEAFGESFTLAEKAGMDAPRLAEILTRILFAGAPAPTGYATRIAATQFEPAGFAMPLGLKDGSLVLKAAEQLRVPMPLASLARDHFLASLAKGGREKWDWGGMAAVLREAAGLPPRR